MHTSGPEKNAAVIEIVSKSFNEKLSKNYKEAFQNFAERINSGQSHALDADVAAKQNIDISLQNPATITAAVGENDKELLGYIKNSTLKQQAEMCLKTLQN
ncbi:hypothetical protein [Chryseobacterium sp.]|uniref:hypothetical protein n=1 Tax=Chryseobacterium sp. TaxID=1871047 RepID=UPI00388FA5E3